MCRPYDYTHYVPYRWVLDKPMVSGVSLGARNASHLADYQALFAFSLDSADQAAISEVGRLSNATCAPHRLPRFESSVFSAQ